MDKGIGFSRTVTLDWLDVTATLCVQKVEPSKIRQQLAEVIAGTVNGIEAQRKTLDVLSAIWIKSENVSPQIHNTAIELFPTLTSPQERLWIHYGMALLYYPFFRKCVAAIGQTSRTDELITRKLIKERIAGDYGHLGALDRSVERIIASLTDWGVLANTDQKNKYKIVIRYFTSSETIQSFLLNCALFAHPSEGIPFEDLIRLPEIFPFKITIGVDNLKRDDRFEVHRQGGGLDLVGLKK